eukprot:scaffold150431_cov65-Attheya_sp.AAC.2
MFRCKEGMRPFNGTVMTVLPKKQYIVLWDPPDGKSETVSHTVLKSMVSLTRNDPDDSDDSSTSRKSNRNIASSDDSNESDNGGESDDSEGDESIDKETMSNIEMPVTVNIKTPCPTVAWQYGQQLLKVPLCELLDHHPMAKQSYKEAIGYAIQDISDRSVEVKPWPENDSFEVQRLHNALLDYDHDYNPEYHKSANLKKMKRLYNLLGDPNHCQVTDYTFKLRVCGGDQDCKLYPNRGIHTPVTDDMELQT